MTQSQGPGAVWQDLGFDAGEAANLRIRAALLRRLTVEIGRRKLTQQQAAELLGISQPRVSDLLRGKLHLFSVDRLINLTAAAGLQVELKVRRVA